jgi:hypothetical protein
MSRKTSSKLPEGASVLELGPYGQSVSLAIDVAELGASDEAVRALGGDEAVDAVHKKRAAKRANRSRDDSRGNNGGHPAASEAESADVEVDTA